YLVQARNRFLGRRALDDGSEMVEDAGRDGLDELVLALEVSVDRARRQPRLAEHVLHRRLVETLAREAAPGGVQDLLSPPLQVLIGDPRHGNNIKRMSALDKPRDSRRHYKERSSDLRRWCR